MPNTREPMSKKDFFVRLHAQLRKGIRRADPVLQNYRGSPESAASSFARQVIESDRASADDRSLMRFVG
jgi:hypothetical protein